MIVKQLRAENILKYRQVQLENLPPRGLIVVSGPNESGKTALAEILCLALFGRTSTLEPRELAQVITWGEFHGSVLCEFTGKDGRDYTVVRDVDGDGNQSARLSRGGEPGTLARGAEAVTQAVSQLGGCTYEYFRDCLYAPQQRGAVPDALSRTARALAGVETVDQIAAELEGESRAAQEAVAQLTPRVTELTKQLADLNVQEHALADLTARRQSYLERITKSEADQKKRHSDRTALEGAQADLTEAVRQFVQSRVDVPLARWEGYAERLGQASGAASRACQTVTPEAGADVTSAIEAWLADFRARRGEMTRLYDLAASYRGRLTHLLGTSEQPAAETVHTSRPLPERQAEDETVLRTLRRRRARVQAAGVGAALLMLTGVAVWWLLKFLPDSAAALWLSNAVGGGGPLPGRLALVAGGAFGVIGLALLMRNFRLTRRIADTRQTLAASTAQTEQARAAVQSLEGLAAAPLPAAVEGLRQLPDEPLASAATAFATGPGAPLLAPEAFGAYGAELQAALDVCRERMQTAFAHLERQGGAAEAEMKNVRSEVHRLGQEIAEEQARREGAEHLQRDLCVARDRVDEHQRQIAVRRVADQLLGGMPRRLYTRFNLELRRVAGKILPPLTGNHYQNIRIDEDLGFQLFSNEKGDFIGVNEISGGTYQQVMLAIRLALAQALASVLGTPQPLILDEPFAFVDEQRTREALQALAYASDDFAQVWVTVLRPDVPREVALHLRRDRESDTLVAGGVTPAPAAREPGGPPPPGVPRDHAFGE